MLRQILCDKFVQQKIIFHSGLNAVVGDEIASNSIGKSTMLMIIDFVFGGDDYITRNHDTVDNLGHHIFKFSFTFEDGELFFSRSTNEFKFVAVCNRNFEVQDTIKINDYTKLLQEKYKCQIDEMSFRSIVGRYFRVYGKENLNERKPIQYFEKEKKKDSIVVLLKLFDKYRNIKEYEKQIQKLTDEKNVLLDAAKKELIPKINKAIFGQNTKKIDALNEELKKLKDSIVSSSVDIEALVSKEILELRKKKSSLTIQKNVYESRLKRTLTNIADKNIKIDSELERLVDFFPNFNVEQVKKIDSFHASITKILKEELQKTEKEIRKQIAVIVNEITKIDQEIADNLTIQNAPKYAIEKVVELASQIKQLTEENGFYTKKKNLDDSIVEAGKELDELKVTILDEVCNQINIKMHELNKRIYSDNRRAPTLSIRGERYTFNTYGDTGTGTAFANLITFDLALLELTCLPAIAHDLPLLKNIENHALENIVELYSTSKKQIFIAIDKINSYKAETEKIITDHKVLQLSKDKLLFIKNWKQDGQ
ncbi:DUF2326 domain-containing protein [Brevibacillus parabrevis]|uniref:DUF2326 domain-containing protein n=1 Tax=Brevibacillus parabrevis TaxID=54914 RepID=A0A4Y3PNB7_BREPA|nr:DUF2326 domain-containing protein [Brevibacillus parabrevis]RNB96201.1 DUF2326 domain-containing protein [Brevibacillus parabrevis]GEB32818.1 hypothetical protein BPA01_23980 [Brevibacillus parabrevis]